MTTGLLLAVDVGNSKTHVAIADASGHVLSLVKGPGASPQVVGVAGSWEIVATLTRRALAEVPGRPSLETVSAVSAAALAVAGLDFPEHETAFAAARPDWLADTPTHVVNDTFAVLRQHTAGDGIAVVVGAGMNCVAVAGARTIRFPALGAISGDWGGGLMIAEAAIGAAARAVDGRGPDTALRSVVPEYFGVPTVEDVLRAIVSQDISDARRAALAEVVLRLADEGEPVCAALARRQAAEVVALVHAAHRRLGPTAGGLTLAFGGGILTARCTVLDTAIDELLHLDLAPVRSADPPVHGVIQLAAALQPSSHR